MIQPPDALRVELRDIEHAYGQALVLDAVSLSIAAGESLALLGASGCGKTTLLRVIAGLERPRRGHVEIGDVRVAGGADWVPPERRKVGMVFQDWALFPHLSVGANVAYGLPRSERRGPRVAEALELVGLAGLEDRHPATLSGGQQQRVALARALAPRPSVLLLDEPFSNLDSTLRVEVRSEVHRLLHELSITSVFVTHDQEEAFVLGDRVGVMRSGRIVQVATPQDLYRRPVDRHVAEFVGSGAIIRTRARAGMAATPCGELPVALGDGPVDVLLRPEQLAIEPGGMATVELVEFYGHDAMVVVAADGHPIQVRCGPDVDVKRGDRVDLRFTGEVAVAFPVG